MTTYLLLGLGVASLILYLLWRKAVSERKRAQREAQIEKGRSENLRSVVKLERRLRNIAAGEGRKEIEDKIKTIEERVLGYKPGTRIRDIFGKADPDENKQ